MLNARKTGLLGIALAVALLLVSCVEEEVEAHQVDVQASAIAVTPELTLTGLDSRSGVRIDDVMLHIGSIELIPNDDPSAPVASNRAALVVVYNLVDGFTGPFVAEPIHLQDGGQYEVRLTIVPKPADVGGTNERSVLAESDSVYMAGMYFEGVEPLASPEPVPWHEEAFSSQRYEEIESGRVTKTPFVYETKRTAIISLGDVDIQPEHSVLDIEIDLGGWIDDALAPLLEEVSGENELSNLQFALSGHLENAGFGLEKLFKRSSAEPRER